MTRNETSYRQKGRAVFLAAIMVLSVVALSTAFVGNAAAEEPRQENDFDTDIAGNLLYEGQVFNVTDDNSKLSNGNWEQNNNGVDLTSQDRVYLVRVTDRTDGNISSASTVGNAISVEDTDSFELDLGGLSADEEYAISSASGSSGQFSEAFDINVQDVDADWDDDSVTNADSAAELDIELGRNEDVSNYNLTVWATGPEDLSSSQIEDLLKGNDELNETLFVDTDANTPDPQDFLPLRTLDDDYDIDVDPDARSDSDNLDELDDQGIVTFELNETELGTEDELNLEGDFSNIEFPDDGEYEFNFVITDSGAADTASVELSEQDENADFSSGTYQSAAGDVAEFEFELEDTDEAWVQIGDDDSDFLDVLYVAADNEDDPIEVEVNTRLLGTNQSDVSGSDVYNIDNEDGYASAYHDGIDDGDFGTPSAALFEDDGDILDDLDAYYNALGTADQANESLTRPLQPTDYEMQIAGTDVDNALFDADSGAGEANDQLDSAVLELQQPEIGDITTHTAPEESADDEDEIAELVDVATESEDIALEDRLIVQIEATGIYGSMVANPSDRDITTNDGLDTDFDRLGNEVIDPQVLANIVSEDGEHGVTLDIEAGAGAGNQDPRSVDFDGASSSEVAVLADNDGGQFFVVVDTDADDAWSTTNAPDDPESYTVDFEYDADASDDRFEFDNADGVAPQPFSATSGSDENYPYLQQGEVLTGSAEFDLEEREITFDNLNADSQIQAQNTEDSEISGTTNVAPGSDAEIRLRSTDASSSFRLGNDVNISEDGSITTAYDLSSQEVGDEFTASFRVSGSSVDSADGVVVEAISDEPADDGETNETDDGDMDDGETEPADDGETNESTDDGGESTDDGTPGFGAVVALIALIGAALLAVRRQN